MFSKLTNHFSPFCMVAVTLLLLVFLVSVPNTVTAQIPPLLASGYPGAAYWNLGMYPAYNPMQIAPYMGGYPGGYPGAYPQGGYYPTTYPGGYYPGGYPGGYYPTTYPGGYPGGYYPTTYPGGYPGGYYPTTYPGGYPGGYYPTTYPGGYPGAYPQGGYYPTTYPGGYPSSYYPTYPSSYYPTYPSSYYPTTYPSSYYPTYPSSYYTGSYYPVNTDVNLTATNDGGSISVDKGQTIGVVLSSNPTTGYQWVLDTSELDSSVVSRVSNQYYSGYGSYTGALGAGGMEQWIFEAEDDGTTTIKLDYMRTWDYSVQDTFEVDITVD